ATTVGPCHNCVLCTGYWVLRTPYSIPPTLASSLRPVLPAPPSSALAVDTSARPASPSPPPPAPPCPAVVASDARPSSPATGTGSVRDARSAKAAACHPRSPRRAHPHRRSGRPPDARPGTSQSPRSTPHPTSPCRLARTTRCP